MPPPPPTNALGDLAFRHAVETAERLGMRGEETANALAVVRALVARVDSAEIFSDGETALTLAVWARQPGLIDALLLGGANPNAKSMSGWAPLHTASLVGDVCCCLRLLRAGAAVGDRTLGGLTPLHAACHSREQGDHVARLLLAWGASAWLVTTNHQTPAAIAAENNRPGLSRMLLAAEAMSRSQAQARFVLNLPAWRPRVWDKLGESERLRAAVSCLLAVGARRPVLPAEMWHAVAATLCCQHRH